MVEEGMPDLRQPHIGGHVRIGDGDFLGAVPLMFAELSERIRRQAMAYWWH